MKIRSACFLGGVLLLGLGVFRISSALIEPPPPPLPVATIVPPAIPHSLEGRADCRLCHEAGIGGAPRFPADHSERPSDICRTCHQEASFENGISAHTPIPPPPVETTPTVPTPTAPTEVSAGELYGARCAACHGANRQGVPGLAPALTPESMAVLSDIEIKEEKSDGGSGASMPAFKAILSPQEIDALVVAVS